MINTVSCPNCGTDIEVTQALVDQIQKQLVTDLEQKHKTDLEKMKKDVEVTVKKQLEEKNTLELADLKKQNEEKEAKLRKMQEEELLLREKTRKLEAKEKELDLEVARKVDEERKKAEEQAIKQISEVYKMKELEWEKKLRDTTTALEEAQRKAHQGSQQLQGEVQELDFEQILRELFPQDAIEPVGKGVRGADISHTVRSPRGIICGVILWESKRTKSWSADWTGKLKEDVRQAKAHIPVIISTVLPEEAINGIGLCDGVWVTNYALAPALASLLRKNLLDVAYQKALFAHQGEKADLLYDYVTGHEFRQQIEAIVEVYNEMQQQIIKERVAFEKSWKAREGQILRMIRSTANIYGSMQGVIGASLPQLKGLELMDGEDEQQNLV